jgi:methionyl-tRNA formyltransferase
MSDPAVLVLCNDRIALPALRSLAFYGRLAGIAVPKQNKDWIDELKIVFKDIPVIGLHKVNWQEKVNDLFVQSHANLGMLMTFPWKLDQPLIDLPAWGFLNFHYGMLPQYRGANPIFSQLRNREALAGLSIHRVSDKMDGGPIVMQDKLKLNNSITYGQLHFLVGELGAVMMGKLLEMISFGSKLPSREQDESLAAWYDRPTADDVTIHWGRMGAAEIVATINACNPWNKGAITSIKGWKLRVVEAVIDEQLSAENVPAGTIVSVHSGIAEVVTKDHQTLQLRTIYTEYGFSNAFRLLDFGIKQGDSFE